MTVATSDTCKFIYACWLLDLFEYKSFFYCEVWFPWSIILFKFKKRLPEGSFFTQKMMFVSQKFRDVFSWFFFFWTGCIIGQISTLIKICISTFKNVEFSMESEDFVKTLFQIIACSTSPPGVNPVDGLPPVLNTGPCGYWWLLRPWSIAMFRMHCSY